MTQRKATPSPHGQTKTQIERFKETARLLQCDENGATFDENLKGITANKRNKSREAAAKEGDDQSR